MGISISEDIYKYILSKGGVEGEDVFAEDGEYFFNGDWEDFNLTDQDGEIWTISTTPSQKGVFIGNLV